MSRKIPNKTAKSREKPMTGVFDVASNSISYNAKKNLTLYRMVYQGRLGTMAVLLLCLSFFFQGADFARANTEMPLTEVESVVIESGEATLVGEVNSEAITLLEEEESTFTDVAVTESLPEEAEDLEVDLGLLEEIESDTDSAIDDGPVLDDSFAEEPEGVIDTEDTDSDRSDDIFITEDNATSSEVVSEVVAVAYSDDSFSFNKAECTELASGSFYCQKPQENNLEDALFAAPDQDGDLEIFLVRAGVEFQVTHNQTDDAAPFFDQNSNTIVWQRLIDDRYQIVSYEIDTGQETILTKTAENNMEPNRQGSYTVWQRWVDGGWNIILHDGESEKQLTKTTSHNVAPYIHGTLVVWNRHDQVNDRTIEMYDLTTDTYVSIEDPDGLSVANPRMVFVYDSIRPNGDIVTKGYDLLAKKFIDLDTLPRNLPDDLPNSDSTGETRALIQNKPSGKSEIEELSGGEVVAGSTPGVVSATSTPPASLASSSAAVLDLTEAMPTTSEPTVVTPTDLIIAPAATSEATELEAVIPQLLPELSEVVEFVIPE